MNSENAADAYLQASFESAPPIKILRLLYGGALRFLRTARDCHDKGDAALFTSNLKQADAIVSELRCSLDHEAAPELTAQLDSLYDFVQTEMSEAVIDCDPTHIESALSVMLTLSEAWNEIELPSKEQAA
jgi:flagellar protein FliS